MPRTCTTELQLLELSPYRCGLGTLFDEPGSLSPQGAKRSLQPGLFLP
jgi:hypothetical protein